MFEENGELCAEIIIDFDDLKAVGLFQYDSKGPYMFNVGSFLDSETYLKSNGEFGGDVNGLVTAVHAGNLKTRSHVDVILFCSRQRSRCGAGAGID